MPSASVPVLVIVFRVCVSPKRASIAGGRYEKGTCVETRFAEGKRRGLLGC